MTDYVWSMTEEELVALVREFLLEHGVVNSPIRQIAGNTYYFSDDEVYTLDKGSQLFAYEGRLKFHLFKVEDYSSFNMNVWSKASRQFKVGMTLTDCIKIFLDTELEINAPLELPYLDRLIQRIEAPEYERVPENLNEATFDRIRVYVYLPRYMFNTWDELRGAVKENRSEIDRRVLQKIETDRHFKKYKVPINFIKLSTVILRRTYALEYIFELRE